MSASTRTITLIPLPDLTDHPENPTLTTRVRDLITRAAEGRTPDECWPTPGTRDSGGYAVLCVNYRQHRVGRVILNIDGLDHLQHQACHRCDNPPCINPAHLYEASAAENQHDKRRKGRGTRGERNPGGGKLTEADVRAIRRLGEAKVPQRTIAGIYGVTQTMIGYILRGEQWAHVR